MIFDKFKKALEATNFNGIVNGLRAIIKIADPRGQEAFDLLRAKFKGQDNIMGFINNFESQFKAALKQ